MTRTAPAPWSSALAKLTPLVLGFGLSMSACQKVNWGGGDEFGEWEPPAEGPLPDEYPSDEAPPDDPDEPRKPKLDVPGGLGLEQCSLVDLLFVIDNSNSMIAEQANLIASFDGFIAGIQANLDEANDYHIGVVTTDAYALNEAPCQELGALVTASAAGACGPWAAGRYISLADELGPAFTCAASVGADGDSNERQIGAALAAISPERGAPGACNEGFLRDEALLVLVLITDEDDPGSPIPGDGTAGSPATWFAELVARKGLETNIVVLALAGIVPPNACNNGVPFEGAQISYRIAEFVKKFTYGEMGDVCASDYSGFFAGSLALIRAACDNFMPEG